MRKNLILSMALLPVISLTSACAVGPDYRPATAIDLGVPDAYSRGGGEAQSAEQLATWWKQFNDPQLNALIERALAENLDIAVSAARLKQARESLIQTRAEGIPGVDASGSAGRNFSSDSPDRNSLSLGASADWEIDLFGRIARSTEAARADLEGAGYNLANVRTLIIAEVATNYLDLRLAQERLRIARETLAIDDENLEIAGWRVQAGLVSSLDEQQARSRRASTAASIPSIERGYHAALNRLAVLTGQAPGQAMRALEEAQPIPTAPTDIATGIPADTLRQRPDVRAAERNLASATARIGVTEASLYPSLGLRGNIGTSALSIGGLADTVTAGLFSSISQMIFDGGRRRSQVRSQEAAAEAALASYRQSVLSALEDVENALVALDASRTRAEQLAIAYEAANLSTILARSQYRSGLTDFQTLLQSEQSLLNARESLAATRADQAAAIVQLYRALGGGWQSTDGLVP